MKISHDDVIGAVKEFKKNSTHLSAATGELREANIQLD